MIEILAISAGAIVSGGVAYFFVRRRGISMPRSEGGVLEPSRLRHQHSRWKKDKDTNLYYCADCGDRYLDGKPK